jgi:hypothetical protein
MPSMYRLLIAIDRPRIPPFFAVPFRFAIFTITLYAQGRRGISVLPRIVPVCRYAYSGHSAIMGRRKRTWQDTDGVLGLLSMIGLMERLPLPDDPIRGKSCGPFQRRRHSRAGRRQADPFHSNRTTDYRYPLQSHASFRERKTRHLRHPKNRSLVCGHGQTRDRGSSPAAEKIFVIALFLIGLFHTYVHVPQDSCCALTVAPFVELDYFLKK